MGRVVWTWGSTDIIKTYFWSFRIHSFMTSDKIKVFLNCNYNTGLNQKSNLDISEYERSKVKKKQVSRTLLAESRRRNVWRVEEDGTEKG